MLVIAQTEYMTFTPLHIVGRAFQPVESNRTLVEPLMAKVLTLDEVDLEGRTVLVRVDINSPLDPETNVFLDDTRIKENHSNTEQVVQVKSCSMAHQSRPKKISPLLLDTLES